MGSYEGKGTIFIIENLANTNDLEIHCVDSWEGGIENKEGGFVEADMSKVEARFVYNTRTALSKSSQKIKLELHKGLSNKELPKLVANNMKEYFDFIYIDGSHQAPGVLFDAVLCFELLKKRWYFGI